MPAHLLSEANIERISIVDKGANRRRWFLRKAEGEGDDAAVAIESRRLVKAEDWSAVYCVVAEPDALEGPGIAAADQSIDDRWLSADEIRKAAHRFMKNGGAITRMHESLEPYGQLVENAVALADFTIDGELIKAGSWYIAIEPNADGKAAIEDGTFGGISIEGTATRTLVEKAASEDHSALDDLLLVKPTSEGGTCSLAKTAGAALPGLDRSAKQNWVDQVGGLPSLIDRAARHLHTEKGRTVSAAIATAVNWAKKMCASGTAFGGKVKVSAKAQAAACAAVAEWEAKKAAAHVTKAKVAKGEIAWETEEGSSAYLRSVGSVNDSLLKRIAKAVGISDEELVDVIEKAQPTFSQRMAERELDDELPEAMSVLRSVVWSAFYPPADGSEVDPRAVIEQSLDEFKSWALDLLDRVPLAKIEDQVDTDDAVVEVPFDSEDVELEKGTVKTYQRVANGKTIAVRAYARNGGAGGLTRQVGRLDSGAGVKLPDGIEVKRKGDKFDVLSGADGNPRVATHDSAALAAVAAMQHSVKSTHPKSVGGAHAFKSLNHFKVKQRGKAGVKKSEGSTKDPANVEPMSWTEEENARIEKIEGALEKLTPEEIAKAVAEASKEPEAPTPEELRAELTKVSEAVTKIAENVEALGEGGTSQNGKEPVQKAEAEGGGIFT